jgi:D-3-phosphoglycerate dehydrogenase
MPPIVWTEVALHPEALARLEQHATVIASGQYDDLPGVEAAIIGTSHVGAAFIERAGPQLKMVVRHGIGYNTLDVPTATRYGVLCCNTPDAPTESTAEHTVGLLLAVAKVIVRADRTLRNNEPWRREDFLGIEVRERVLGVIGYGRIGRRVAEICALGLKMQVLVYDPFLREETALLPGMRVAANLDEVLAEADFLTLHTPLSAATHHLIGERELRAMKPGACLLNVSRGPVVDEAALIRALADGHLGGAGLDVFDPEPPDPKNPLLHMAHVVVTPHVASFTDKGIRSMSMSAVDQVLQVIAGKRPDFVIDATAWPGRMGTTA